MRDLKERTAIFVDGESFRHSLLDMFQTPICICGFDFPGFFHYISDNNPISSINYYMPRPDHSSRPEIYAAHQKFIENMEDINKCHVRLCNIKYGGSLEGGKRKKMRGDDIQIALDMFEGAVDDTYDRAVLVSSDSDFFPAIYKTRQRGKRVSIISTAPSHLMTVNSDRFILLTPETLQRFLKNEPEPKEIALAS